MTTTTRYFKRKGLLAKIETTPGTDAGPTASANAVEARNVQFTPLDATYVENNVEVPYFGNSPELPVSQAAKLAFDVAIQGPGTAGQAPAFGPLLRGAGMAETLLAAAATGTAQAGGANTITLAGTASAVDNAYRGMFLSLTGGTGSGQSGFVLSYNGTSKVATMAAAWTTPPDATTTYSLGAQAVYAPVSQALESLSLYMYMDGLLHKLLYARGNVKAKLTPKSLPVLSFDFLALFAPPTDEPLPASMVLTGYKQPNPVTNDWSSGVRLHGFDSLLYDLSCDLGQKTKHRDDVVGVDDVLITDRGASGNAVIAAGLLAEFDPFTIAKNATLGPLLMTHGIAAGSRFRLAAPGTQVKAPKYENKDGVNAYGMDLRFNPVNGNDEVFFIFD